jgi:hypothetical protein
LPYDPLMLNAADGTAIGTIALALRHLCPGSGDRQNQLEVYSARVIVTVFERPVPPCFAAKELLVAYLIHFDREGPVVSPGTDDGDAGKPRQNQDLSKMISILHAF